MNSKILSPSSVADALKMHKLQGKTVALSHGVFDLLHAGHFAHFRAAKRIADVLVVSVTSDAHVNKGPGRPLFDLFTRMNYLSDLEMIDFVIPSNFPTAVQNIEVVKPDVYLKDKEYAPGNIDITGNILKEVAAVEKCGGRVEFTTEITASSTSLINRQLNALDSTISKWLYDLRKKYTILEIFNYIDKLQNINVGVVGEIILDRYSQCSPLAKSSKDPILAFHLHETDTFRGGVLAIADTLSQWAKNVSVYSFLGKGEGLSELVLENKNGNISYKLIEGIERPNIVKHRFVENSSKIRLFETYQFDPIEFAEIESKDFWQTQVGNIAKEDCVIVADYGHGLMNNFAREIASKSANFLSVNAQANAGNRGYNTITKYPHMDLMCLNGSEFQLEIRDANPDYRTLIPKYMKKLKCKYAIVTLGGSGLYVFDDKNNFSEAPALGAKIVDKVGAGDSVLAISSLLAKIGAPVDLIGLLASIVAAHEISQLGHRTSMSNVDLKKSVKGLLG